MRTDGALRAAWMQILGVDEVNDLDNFFALGGDSLAAVELVTIIREETGVDVPLVSLFQDDSFAGLRERWLSLSGS